MSFFYAIFSFWDKVDFVLNIRSLEFRRIQKKEIMLGGFSPHSPHLGLHPQVPGGF